MDRLRKVMGRPSNKQKSADNQEIKEEDGEGQSTPVVPELRQPQPINRVKTNVKGTEFFIDSKYKIGAAVGRGATGFVVAATNTLTGEEIAIKKVGNAFDEPRHAVRFLREIQLMRFLDHPNILGVRDIQLPSESGFSDLYLVVDKMDADLHAVIKTQRRFLSDRHWTFFMYQLCCGVKFMHSANVIHRDLKPSNLLADMNCNLKICDFGLSRGLNEGDSNLTEYVVTRWYRAPEIMLGCRSYDKPIDIWAVGCIFGEILHGKPLFRGRDYIEMLRMIVAFLGKPSEADLSFVQNPRAKRFLLSLPDDAPLPLAVRFPDASPLSLDLLSKMLTLDPQYRISIAEALAHPYFAELHEESEEAVADGVFTFPYEDQTLTSDDLRQLVFQEVLAVRAREQQHLAAVAAEEQGSATAAGAGETAPAPAVATASAATPGGQ